jgi:tetratricopeptide (TPR) repeat protein
MGVDWRKDYESARAESREKGRLLLLHFYMAGRPVCKAMDDETFANPDVARVAREKFVSVRVDVDAQPKLFDSTVGGRGGLATCVLDGEGDVVSALTGFAAAPAFLKFLQKGETGAASVKAAREALSKAPDDASALLALAEAYRGADSLRRADEVYRKVLDGFPASPAAAAAHERLARLRVMRGKNVDARNHLAAARRLDPEGRVAAPDRLLLTEALALAIERKHAAAAVVLESALRSHPGSPEADHMLYALGFVLHQDGKDKPAMEVFERALREHPASTWISAVREQIEHIKNPQPDHEH